MFSFGKASFMHRFNRLKQDKPEPLPSFLRVVDNRMEDSKKIYQNTLIC